MILTCTCKHEGQDSIHGRGRRVFNETRMRNPTRYRCTVCGAERTETGGVTKSGRQAESCSWPDVVDYVRRHANKSVNVGPPPKAQT